ncbi:hypothetical protein RHS04_00971 [Rhizoctonia solani]|uniref:Peptidase C19 ubiquitin carboxyl-terminal hydrolase domain-containing protein n=1 Tax=Rhizoctonia solani TaxID=456999 RepID=A0A8H7HE82_9AGAM|nr:hypothetical protein RHS04_00971 [Rhizoctonia solani]
MQESHADKIEFLQALGSAATRDQIANLLKKYNGNAEIVAGHLLDGNFDTPAVGVSEPEERGRTMNKSAPALPPRRKHSSPVDNSMALVPTTGEQPPRYDQMEDDDMKKALALSMEDQGPPPLEPIPEEYGPYNQQDVKKYDNRARTDHALRQALEASLNDGKSNLAADLYVDRPAEERGRESDGRPVAFRSSDQNSIFAPPIFQALMALAPLRARLKEQHAQFTPNGDQVAKENLEHAWHDSQLTRDMMCHAECTQQAYIDIKPWTGEWSDSVSAHSPATAATELLGRLTKNLNLALASPITPLFLPTIDSVSNEAKVPKSPLPPHVELTKPQDQQYYVIPLAMGAGSPNNNNLADILEYHIAADGLGFVRDTLPEILSFKVDRSPNQSGGTGKFGFPARLWFDRWVMDKRDFVLRTIKSREKDIEEQVKTMESESVKLRKCEGRDTLADLRACIRHFEHTATDGGDPKRKVRNDNTLKKLKSILKDIEDKLAAVVIHDGLLGRAHIFSYIRYNDKWWKIVDDDVTEASEETVLSDSSGVHLGSGAFLMFYSKPNEGKESPWPRKDRIKSQKLDEEFRATLPPTVRFKFEKSAQIISPTDSDEDEYMDAEESIIVEADPAVDKVEELGENKADKLGDETDKRRDDGMQDVVHMRDVD